LSQGVFLFNATPPAGSGAATECTTRQQSTSRKGKDKKRGGSNSAAYQSDSLTAVANDAAAFRHALFKPCWTAIETDITRLLAEQNRKVFADVVGFFQSQNDSPSPFNEVPTAVLLTGINSPDHAVMFISLKAHIESELTPHVVLLRSDMCRGLKGVMRTVIDALLQTSANTDQPTETTKGTLNYDIQLLEGWYDDQLDAAWAGAGSSGNGGAGVSGGGAADERPHRRPIVVVFEDFEAFDVEALSDFIVMCSQRRKTLPIVFLFGVASSVEILGRQLPRQAICALNTSKFRLRQSSATLSDVVAQVVMSANHPFKLGPKPLQQLVDNFLYHNLSISSFTRGLKLATLSHFVRNPLSILCRVNDSGSVIALTSDQLETLRLTPAFRELVEAEDDSRIQRRLLMDDGYLTEQIPALTKTLHEQQTMFRCAVLCLRVLVAATPDTVHGLSKFLPSLYAACLRRRFIDHGQLDGLWPLLLTCAADTLVEMLSEFETIAEGAIMQCSMSTNTAAVETLGDAMSLFQQHRTDVVERKDAPPAKEVTMKGATGAVRSASSSGGGGAAAAAATKPSAADILSGVSSSASEAVSAPKNRRALLSGSNTRKETPFSRLRKSIVESIQTFLIKWLSPPSGNVVGAGFFFEGSVKDMLEGRPRGAIEKALVSPSQYLGATRVQPDTVVLYHLHLECGRLINIYDLLMSFAEVTSPDSKCDKVVQARFFRALSELQYLGYMSATKRKTDHMVRLTSGAGAANTSALL
jgi:origin recognition complex subunit 3